MDELFNNPYYWNNNKRRFNGLKPFRKNKQRINKILHSEELFNAISTELEKQYAEEITRLIDQLVDIKDITLGEKI